MGYHVCAITTKLLTTTILAWDLLDGHWVLWMPRLGQALAGCEAHLLHVRHGVLEGPPTHDQPHGAEPCRPSRPVPAQGCAVVGPGCLAKLSLQVC